MALRDAVYAVYDKINTDVNNASPEELAYLSTSLEKLGGRATVYDVMDVGDDVKKQLEDYLAQKILDVDSTIETTVAETVARQLVDFNNLVLTSKQEIDDIVEQAKKELHNDFNLLFYSMI